MGGGYHGREIFENVCMKTSFSRTLNAIIRGSLCSGIDQFPPLFLFLLNLSQGTFLFSFFFLFLFSPFFFPPPLSLFFSSFLPFLPFFGHRYVRGGQSAPLPPFRYATALYLKRLCCLDAPGWLGCRRRVAAGGVAGDMDNCGVSHEAGCPFPVSRCAEWGIPCPRGVSGSGMLAQLNWRSW